MRASPHRWMLCLSLLSCCGIFPDRAAGQDGHRQLLPAIVCIRAGTHWVEGSSRIRQTAARRWQGHAGRGFFDHRAALLELQTPLDKLGGGAPLVNDRGELVGLLSWSQAWNERGEPASPVSFASDVS